MRLNYLHHYDADEVGQILLEAQQVVRDLNLDPELFRTAFEKAIDLLSNKVAIEAAGPVVMPGRVLRPQ